MKLPNEHFQDFPIEYKQINPEDFSSAGFDVEEKVIIEPNGDGYIFDALRRVIGISDKKTVVVNAPVGYGKSYAIIKLIKAIYDIKPKSKIIVATPFVSLVEQYVTDINKVGNVPSSDIYSYSNLGRNKKESYKDKRVHVLTVNTLLGNPGEDGFKNSDAKRLYIDNIIDESFKDNSEVFFIYDEIHDAIQNFKEEFMLYLWKWKNVIHQNIILSATYNEASKVVIKYLAELTDMKIQIIESVRRIFPEKQSQLFLHYSSDYNFKSTTNELINLVDNLLLRNRNIDILCYSKSLAKSIISDKDGVGKKLKDRFGKLNDCTSELLSNQRPENLPPENRYKHDSCNIGTNFKTGISIKKDNHSFIIILPPRGSRLLFKNLYGIFSNGINDIIQSFARQRTNGEIHVILPRPDEFNFESLKKTTMSQEQRDIFEEHYSAIKSTNPEEENPVHYISLDKQNIILQNFYNEKLYGFLAEDDLTLHLKKRNILLLPRLEFPPFEIWKLNRGEKYLANAIKFFGEDLSAYVTYCAFTNQFINCSLTEINYKSIVFFEEGSIQKQLYKMFDEHFGGDYLKMEHAYSNFTLFYEKLKNEFFNNFQIKLKGTNSDEYLAIKPGANKLFEIQFLIFAHILYHDYDLTDKNVSDFGYSRGNYLLDSIVIAKSIDLEKNEYSQLQKERIIAFKSLGLLRERMINSVLESKKAPKFKYLLPKLSIDFIKPEETKMVENIFKVLGKDELFENEVFLLIRNLEDKDNLEDKIQSLYKVLLDAFFIFSESKKYSQVTTDDGIRKNVKPIKKIIDLPEHQSAINLLITSGLDNDYISVIEERILQISTSKDGSPKYQSVDEYYSDILSKLQN